MVSEKKRLQQLRQPDEFQKKAFRAVDWILGHQRQFLMLLVPVLLVSVAGISWRYYQGTQGENRRAELQKIDAAFNKAAESVAETQEKIQKDIEAIEEKLQASSGQDATPAGQAKPAAAALSAGEQAELLKQRVALEAQIKTLKPDHKQTLESYQAFYQKYKASPEGWRAALAVITGLVQEEKFAEAAKLAQEVIGQASGVDFYQQQVRSLYISLLEEQGQYEAALSEADKLLAAADEDSKPKALLMKGRLELLSGKKEQGLATLDQLVSAHNSSPEAQKAKAIKALW